MPARTEIAHVVTTTCIYKDKVYRTHLLRRSYREGSTVKNDLYAAMDWLLERQGAIQKKLAARHLSAGGLVLYDLSLSHFEGTTCPLARLGYSRDGKRGLLQVNYGLLTDARGCPVAVSVHEGNVADSATLLPEVQRLREHFGIEQLVMVGDRGMIGHKAIAELRQSDGVGWITALKSASISALLEQGQLQPGLFDERNLVELASPEYPGERLVACRNPSLATLRAQLQGVGQRGARVPVAPAQRSDAARAKVARHTLDDGTPVHSLSTLMAELSSIVRNTCRTPSARPEAPSFDIVTTPTASQRQALELIQKIRL